MNIRVTHATLSQVLRSTAYLLFYVKKDLDYEPESRPSYVKAREADILRERQKEKEKELRLIREIDDELMSIL
jgi:ubiquitin carboxyl-terminal hydrolase 22/27/51